MNGQSPSPTPRHYDVLIIGGGIVGFTTALAIRQLGAAVVVVDQSSLGRESSWAGAGILSPLLPWQYTDAVNALCRHGGQCHESLVSELLGQTGLDSEYFRCGMTMLPPYDEDKAVAWCAAQGVRLEQASGGTLRLPDVAQVRNPRLLHALGRSLSIRKITLLENTEVIGLRISSGRVFGVETPGGILKSGKVVVCAGAWTQKLLGKLGATLNIRPIRGQMLLFKGAPGKLNTILYRDGVYLVPRRDGHVLVGSTLEDVGFNKGVTEEAKTHLYKNALEMFPVLESLEFVRQWAGLRPGTPDNVPIISRHPEIENLYVNAGHFRYGVTMAPASAEIITALITGGTPPIPAEPYAWPGY